MSDTLWSRSKPLFDEARQRPAEGRGSFLDEACRNDHELRAEVERLLAIEHSANSFFDTLGRTIRPSPEQVPPPERIGPWRVVREIGRGGMGRVFLGERNDGVFEQQVAIKMVEIAAPGIVRRFRRERRILARLDHPGVARLLDGGAVPDGRPYLVMEYVEGGTLVEYADRKRLGLEERLRLFIEVCEAVAYAHRSLVVHRDLKPSNILVSETDGSGEHRVKLLDFGIATLLEDDEGSDVLTGPGQRLHTPVYAAPEQVLGGPVTTATDVYALGVVLYELLTRRRPFGADVATRRELERAIVEDAPTAPSKVAGGDGGLRRGRIAGDLDRILLKALRKEPDRRYGSVESLARDVERHLAGLPVEARRSTVSYRLGSFVRRHRLGVAFSVFSLLLALALGVLHTARVTQERNRAEGQAERAHRAIALLTDVLAQAEVASVDTGTLLRLVRPMAAQADKVLASDPDARATIYLTLGRLYNRVGGQAEADSLIRKALAVRRLRHPGPDKEVAAALFALGERFIPEPDSAVGYFRASAVMRRAIHDGDDRALAWSLLQWDRMLPLNHADKGRRYREALAMLKRLHGTRSPEVAEAIGAYHVLGLAGGDKQDYVNAFSEALDIFLENGMEADSRTLATMYNLGLVYEGDGRFDEAFALYRRAIKIGGEALPPGSTTLITMQTNFGATLHEQGRFAEADSALSSVAARTRLIFPVGSRPVGHSHYWYGRNLNALGDYDRAEPVLRTARESLRAQSTGGARYHRAQMEWASALLALGRPAEAEPLLRESLTELRGTPYESPARLALARARRQLRRPATRF